MQTRNMSRTFDELNEELNALQAKRQAMEDGQAETLEARFATFQEAAQHALKEQIEREKKRIERLEQTPNHPQRRKAQALLRKLTPEETQRVIDFMQDLLADRDN